MAGPLVLAAAKGTGAGAYLFGSILTIFVGLGAVFFSRDRRMASDFRSALLFVLLWWSVAPAFAAVPFIIGGLSWDAAYFEAVSALTTTGAWLAPNAMLADQAGVLWRAELQWIGGLASVTIAAAVFIRPAFIGTDTLLPPFSRGDRNSHLRPIRNAFAAFVGPYFLITVVAVLALLAAGTGIYEAVILAFSTLSSGGLTPREGGLAAFHSGVHVALFPFILVS
ncbi:MAG TPA: potassium transporter TrkG, partial [Parvularculaceae bacterium]|nr:potassium transporter TrkG [Parvularculaceae bacterium]